MSSAMTLISSSANQVIVVTKRAMAVTQISGFAADQEAGRAGRLGDWADPDLARVDPGRWKVPVSKWTGQSSMLPDG